MFDENGLAALVAFVHAADLWDRRVAFIDEQQEIVGKEIQQRVGFGAGFASGEVARVVFDALAEAHFRHHFQVVFRPHADALGFEEFSFLFELGDLLFEFLADRARGRFHFFAGGDELFCREKGV